MEIPQVDQVFAEMTELMDLGLTGVISLEPTELARQTILDDFSDHLITFDDVDTSDVDEMVATVDVLTELLMKSLERNKRLMIGDEIIAYGDSIVILVDEDLGVDFNVLYNNVRLRGIVSSIGVLEIPAQGELSRICNPGFDNEECEAVKLNPFGVVLDIDQASITVDGEEEAIGEYRTVLLPLNYPQLKLFRRAVS